MAALINSVESNYAHAMLALLDEAAVKSDAGVQAIFTYLLAYPSLAFSDLASLTGFDEDKLRNYLEALGGLVEFDGTVWSISDAGDASIKAVLAVASGKVKLSASSTAMALSVTELTRWEEVKRIVMDTPYKFSFGATSRELFERWFSFVDSNPTATLEEATAYYQIPNPDEIGASIVFKNQANAGITIHRPGTQPIIYFRALIKTFQMGGKDNILDEDGPLIEKALSLGLTFW